MEADAGDEMVALDRDAGQCLGFNAVAARVWRLLQQPRRRSEMIDALVAEYEVEADTCARDLDELLAQMSRDGLIATG